MSKAPKQQQTTSQHLVFFQKSLKENVDFIQKSFNKMDLDDQETPQKHKTHKFIINYQQNAVPQSATSPTHSNKATPKNAKCFRKSINPRTPKAQSLSYSMTACNSLMGGNSSAIHSISMAIVQTPPAKRYQRIKNPFEAALTERLHLPLIAR